MATSPPNSMLLFASRCFWTIAGPMLLVPTVASLFMQEPGRLGLADVAYLVILAGMIGGRWVEYLGGNARSSTGESVTKPDIQRYSVAVLFGGIAVWLLASWFVGRIPQG